MSAKKHISPRQLYRASLCLIVALSFLGTLVPIASASRDKSNAMPCCVGKASGHCDSGIAPKRIPKPTSEPMCGLDNSKIEDDAITIVAEPSHQESHHSPAAESISLNQPCPMDCGACATSSTRQQRREQAILQSVTYHNPSLNIHSRFKYQPFSFSSNEDWEQTSPRGPPTNLL